MKKPASLDVVLEVSSRRRDETLQALGHAQRELQQAEFQLLQLQNYEQESQTRWGQRASQGDGTLPRPPSKEEHGVRLHVPSQGRQDRKVHINLRALRLGGVQRALDDAAPGLMLQALQAARLQQRLAGGWG